MRFFRDADERRTWQREIAHARNASHGGKSTNGAGRSANLELANLKGVSCETELCELLGLDPRLHVQLHPSGAGDRGIDVRCSGRTIDAKGLRIGGDLIAGAPGNRQPMRAEITVWGEYQPRSEFTRLLGWQEADTIRRCEIIELESRDGKKDPFYLVPRSMLFPMRELLALIGTAELEWLGR